MKNNIKVVVATHKKYKMPKNEMYLPLHVGAEGKKILVIRKIILVIIYHKRIPFFAN